MRLGDIKDWHAALPTTGGFLQLPEGEIEGDAGEEVVITKNNVKISGRGCNMSDSQLSQAVTQINYSGSGVAIQIGEDDQENPLYGTELKGFGVKGTDSAVAGIRVEGNTGAAGFLSARILIENVDARGFCVSGGCGVDLHYGISVTLRRVHVHQNYYGVHVRWGNGYVLDGLIARHNYQAVRAAAFNGLTITGWSVLESNDGSALMVNMLDHCRHLVLDKVWVEGNNVIESSVNDAVFIQPDVAGLYLNGFLMSDVCFNGGRGNIGSSNVNYSKYQRVKWSNGTYYP